MLVVREYHDGHLSEVAPEKMRFDAIKWMDCYRPTKAEIEQISAITNITTTDLNRIQNDERPDVYEVDHFSILFFKQVYLRKQNFRTNAMALISSKHLLVTIRLEDEELFKPLLEESGDRLSHAFAKGTSSVLNLLIERITHRYFELMDEIQDRIDRVEDEVFASPGHTTSKRIFDLKKGLIFCHRALSGNRDLLMKLEQGQGQHVAEKQLNHLRYTYSDTVQLMDIVATYREILVSAMDIYLSSVSNNLNIVMKRMTALGSLVLVPTLITGIYGMNFESMPEIAWPYGYAFAWVLILVSVTVLTIYFKKKDWF